ncbi:MAG: hypothetical protein GY913_18105 [Proteobacteria bacterium]|nr:hypothetical protein [Pseudomonadota bacterium]
MLIALIGLALAGPSPLPTFSAEEEATLSSGGIVTHSKNADDIVAYIEVAASTEDTFAAILDLPARAGDIDGLEAVTLYVDEPAKKAAHYEMTILGMSGELYVIYTIDAAEGFTAYDLDPTKASTLSSSKGSYQVYGVGDKTRIRYVVDTTGGSAPTWLKKALLGGSMPEQLEGMRTRAEK